MRIKFKAEIEDFVIKKEIKSEMDGATFILKIFMNYLCDLS
jgi:hypothetical protein